MVQGHFPGSKWGFQNKPEHSALLKIKGVFVPEMKLNSIVHKAKNSIVTPGSKLNKTKLIWGKVIHAKETVAPFTLYFKATRLLGKATGY